ncbi:MAG: HAMP domain-containing sensor histidine kinase, partial [Thermoanaerobaculia bacterium]
MFIKIMSGYFERELEQRLISMGKLLSSNIKIYVSGLEKNLEDGKYFDYLKGILKKYKEELKVKRLYIFDLNGESLLDTEDLPRGTPLGSFLLNPSVLKNLKKGIPSTTFLYEIKGEYFKSAFFPLGGGGYANFGLGIEISPDYVKNFNSLKLKIFYFFLISIIFGFLSSYLLSKTLSRPLNKLIFETENLIKSDFEKKVNFNSHTELDRLGNSLEILRQKINQRDEYLKRMVSQVAHEIKNPLSIFGFYLKFLMESQLTPDEKKKYLNILKEETKKIEELLDNFINFVRKKQPKFEYFSLKELFVQIERFFEKKAEEQKIEFIIDVEDGLKVYSDRDFLFHIIFNLIKNSFEAMEGGGRIVISGRVEDFLKIIVKDNGVGIREDIKDKIFEPFFTTKPKGIGLGLTIVEEYAKKLGGEVQVYSKEG